MPDGDSGKYAAAADYLFSLKAGGVKLGIDRMQELVRHLGHPERACPVVHIAGTNGKGSVAAMLEAICRTAGWKTGLYTSPHLVRLGERVQVNRRSLSEEEIVTYVGKLRPIAERIGRADQEEMPSFFEFMTAMAFLQFAGKKCDIALVEVGLGGRCDATNVVTPEISVITSIGLDHCELLGNTHELIAREKAGIIKPGRPVVIGRLPPGAEEVVRSIARERNSPLVSVREKFGDRLENFPRTNLEGDYQRWNAATAALTAQTLPAVWKLSGEAIAGGLQRVHWPGRWQRVRAGGRLLVLDSSHNPEGAQVLEENLRRLVEETGRAPVVIIGVLGTARARPLLEVVGRHARELHLVVPHQPRASTHAELRALVPGGFAGRVTDSTVTALFPEPGICTAGAADEVLVVTGSIYLIGEVMARLEPALGSGEGWLQDF